MSKVDQYGIPLIDKELITQSIDKKLAEAGIEKKFRTVFANPDTLKNPESLPEANRLIDLVMEDLKGMVLEATGKKYQEVLRNLRDAISDGLLLKLAQGRPPGRDEKKSKRDAEIRGKYNLLLAKGFSHEHIQKTLSDEYEVEDIKQIYYSQKP
ncbi:hypothetical protein EB821_03260 [Candidatus Marinimicrobia bacterium PRS2]|nr:hypothetical protein EB821_03260 [Candidatus Marinimicrobia bacterium PRS2]